MSSEKIEPNGSEPTANAATAPNAEATAVDVKALEVSAETHARVLEESKRNKIKAQELKTKLEEIEKQTLLEKEEFKKLYETSEAKFQGLYKSLVKEKVKSTVSEIALKAGCVNVDDLLKLGNAELLQIDDETMMVSGVDSFVEEAKKTKPYLFKSAQTPAINAATPGGMTAMKKLTLSELAKMPATDSTKQKAWEQAFGPQRK